jgi:hypothetical protein
MRDFVDFVSANSAPSVGSETIAAAAACLDRFTAAFNARNFDAMDLELHFPHVMLSGAEYLVWECAGRHPANLFSALEGTGWAYTQYETKLPILASPDKVHFAVTYTRRDKSGNVLSEHQNLWIVTRVREKWGIVVRSY